jgi:steroid 5-alpha reductase family enzyme
MTALALLGVATPVMMIIFSGVWAISLRIHNYGFLDAIWSLSIAILAPLYAVLGTGDVSRRWLFAAVGVLWSLRLGLHVLIRVCKHHPTEDSRYQTLRKRWPGPGMFLVFFELQALLAVVFSLPFLLASANPIPHLTRVEYLGLALATIATAGEAIADGQAQRFKRDDANRGRVLDTGLWRYSRHPNYFFESLVWWGFCLAALPSAYGWITICCPVLMLYFLFRVTGIPITEEHSLQNRGDVYRDYQRRTSRFVPWFPRKT